MFVPETRPCDCPSLPAKDRQSSAQIRRRAQGGAWWWRDLARRASRNRTKALPWTRQRLTRRPRPGWVSKAILQPSVRTLRWVNPMPSRFGLHDRYRPNAEGGHRICKSWSHSFRNLLIGSPLSRYVPMEVRYSSAIRFTETGETDQGQGRKFTGARFLQRSHV